jgi:hypothetical protein
MALALFLLVARVVRHQFSECAFQRIGDATDRVQADVDLSVLDLAERIPAHDRVTRVTIDTSIAKQAKFGNHRLQKWAGAAVLATLQPQQIAREQDSSDFNALPEGKAIRDRDVLQHRFVKSPSAWMKERGVHQVTL